MKRFLLTLLYSFPFLLLAEEENQEQQNNTEQTQPINESNEDVALNLSSEYESSREIVSQEDLSYNQTTFPIQTSFGYDFEKSTGKYFVQAEGKDVINKKRNQIVNFLIKIPYLEQSSKQTKLAVTPQKFLLNFTDPLLEVTLGDAKHSMSHLLMDEYEARGGYFKINQEDTFGFSTLYLFAKPTEDKNPADKAGISCFINPASFIQLSSNFLFTKFTEDKALKTLNEKNLSYSIRSRVFAQEFLNLDMEAAVSNALKKKNSAYLFNLNGNIKYFSYKTSSFYSGSSFIGHKLDKTKLNNLIKFEKDNLLLKLNHQYKMNNLAKSTEQDKAKRENTFQVHASYPFIEPVKSTIGFNKRESKNLTTKDGHRLDAINIETILPIKKYSLEHFFEFGKYKSRIENYKSRNWQNCKISINYNSLDNNIIGIYTKLGNLLYEDKYTLSYALGTNLKIKSNNNFDLSFIYEFSQNKKICLVKLSKEKMKWRVHHIKQELTYTLPNNHKITLTSHLNKPLSHKKEKALLFTYTIPFEVPNLQRTISNIKRTLF